MPVSLFNTASRTAEPFLPLDPAGRLVKMYTCGPTVYNYAHIGNFRAYIFEDLLQRHLEARGLLGAPLKPELPALWRRGGDDRALAQNITDSWDVTQ